MLKEKLGRFRDWFIAPVIGYFKKNCTVEMELIDGSNNRIGVIQLPFLPPLYSDIILSDLERRFYVDGIRISEDGSKIVIVGRLFDIDRPGTIV